ncbi:MAG: hypothetical protein KDC54_15600, partial [Lewinella sp.]|nr:hypothetical protein [Lewinella sp.]
EKGLGLYGDLAIDQITLHGSHYLGYSDQPLYADADGDGYGAPGILGYTCVATPPLGFSFSGDDCDDNAAEINPDAEEIPCNGIDENCNFPMVNDDPLLPPPDVTSDTICSGETPLLTAETEPTFSLFWWDSPAREVLLWIGETYEPTLPPNETPFPREYTYYVEATDLSCYSPTLSAATVLVLPRPQGEVPEEPAICPGDEIDLSSVPIIDNFFTGATVSFHSATPATSANELSSTVVMPAGTTAYPYLLTSPDGCTFESNLTVTVRMAPTIAFSPADSFSVCRLAADTIMAQASGGAGNYVYFWENGTIGPSLPIIGSAVPGTLDAYSLTVTDGEGCTAVDSALVTTTISIDSLIVLTTPVSTCEGADGMIEIVPLNGQPPFSYTWQDATGQSGSGSGIMDTIRITDLPQNAYRITIFDNSDEGCAVSLRNIRVQGPGFQLAATSLEHPSCFGSTDGEICLDVSGSGGLSYTWSDGQTGICATGLMAGTYTVTITNGECTTVETYTLQEPLPLRTLMDSQSPSCAESTDGYIDVHAFGGTPGYDFGWTGGSQGPELQGVGAGVYFLTITDDQGCMLLDTVELLAPPPLTLLVDSLRGVSCAGYDDGFALLDAAGGTPPYTYRWADGTPAALRADLPVGSYSATVTDYNGCTASTIVTVPTPAPLSLTFSVLSQPICRGDSTGMVQIIVNGGTAPYTYEWLDGYFTTDPVRMGLPVGTIGVVVEDANGCKTNVLMVNVTPESDLQLTFAVTAPSCVGLTDGAIDLSATGTAPYQFAWTENNPRFELSDPTLGDQPNVATGTYYVMVVDDRGCIAEGSTEVVAPQVFN